MFASPIRLTTGRPQAFMKKRCSGRIRPTKHTKPKGQKKKQPETQKTANDCKVGFFSGLGVRHLLGKGSSLGKGNGGGKKKSDTQQRETREEGHGLSSEKHKT